MSTYTQPWLETKRHNFAIRETMTGVAGMQSAGRDGLEVCDVANDLYVALTSLMAVENKAWPNYVRQEFAKARAALSRVEGGTK